MTPTEAEVWVLTCFREDEPGDMVVGVYATSEAGIAANPEGRWRETSDGVWWNGVSYDGLHLTRYPVLLPASEYPNKETPADD